MSHGVSLTDSKLTMRGVTVATAIVFVLLAAGCRPQIRAESDDGEVLLCQVKRESENNDSWQGFGMLVHGKESLGFELTWGTMDERTLAMAGKVTISDNPDIPVDTPVGILAHVETKKVSATFEVTTGNTFVFEETASRFDLTGRADRSWMFTFFAVGWALFIVAASCIGERDSEMAVIPYWWFIAANVTGLIAFVVLIIVLDPTSDKAVRLTTIGAGLPAGLLWMVLAVRWRARLAS